MHRRRSLLLVFLTVFTALSLAAQEQPRLLTEEDLFSFVWVADPQISPDGSRVAFVRVQVNAKREGYETSLWTVATSGQEQPQRLTSGPRDTYPRWSPDGKRLLFLRGGAEPSGGAEARSADKDAKPQPPQLHIMSMAGGEPVAITTLPRGVESPAWSPDGKTIAFLSRATADDIKNAGKPEESKSRQSDVRVITRAVYRFNGAGYLDTTRRTHLWTVPVPNGSEPAAKPLQLTVGAFDEQDPSWSPDGRQIYFTSTRMAEPYYEQPKTTLFAIPAAGGEARPLLQAAGTMSGYSISPDGRSVAFRGPRGDQVRSYDMPRLWVAALTDGKAREVLPTLDADAGGGLSGDQHAPRGRSFTDPTWSADGRALLERVSEKGVSTLRRFDAASGKMEMLTSGNHEVVEFTATRDQGRIVAVISTPTRIGDLFLIGPQGKLTQLTDVNRDLFRRLKLTEPEEIWYTSFDGLKIQAWVQKPPDFDPKKKYPLILNIHGGPHAAYGYTFSHEFQWMAAKGYVVLYPNPRGSSSYGQEFGNSIQYRYPGDDHKDLMLGVDELLKRGYIDEKRLGITGGSGGGVLTNWAIGQTNRFAAAVSQRSIADWEDFWYTADFTLFTPTWFRGAPWEHRDDFRARSPITNVDKIETPLMLIEGETDYRTPPSAGGELMFRALKFRRKPVVMVRFPGEHHDLSRSGQPWHRVERLQHIVGWFDQWLLGKRNPIYEMPSQQTVPEKQGEAQERPAPPQP